MPRRLIAILGGGATGLLVALAIAHARGPVTYRSTAILRYTPGKVPQRLVPFNPAIDIGLFNGVKHNVLSRSSLYNLIHTYGLYHNERQERPLFDIVEDMRREDILIERGNDDTVRVSFRYYDPAVAQKIAGELAGRISAEVARARVNMASFNIQFLQNRAALDARDWDLRTSQPATRRGALDIELAKSHYLALREKLADAMFLSNLEDRKLGPILEVQEAASYNRIPEENRTALLVGGGLAGLFIGWVIAWLWSSKAWKWRPAFPTLNGTLKVTAFGLAGLAVAAVAVMVLERTRTYSSTVLLRVIPSSALEHLIAGIAPTKGEDLLQEAIKTVMSRVVLADFVNSYELFPENRSKGESVEQLADRMHSYLTVEFLPEASVRIQFRYSVPWKAQKVAQELVSRVVNEFTRRRSSSDRMTVAFLNEEIDAKAAEWERSIDNAKRPLESELARKEYIALKEKLYLEKIVQDLGQRSQGRTVELMDPASLPVAQDDAVQILTLGTLLGILFGLLRKAIRRLIAAMFRGHFSRPATVEIQP
jgi:hypothetical protein